ncbi:GDSL esterase/lipase At2g31550-like [Papaver somniferum]|uniref:GDSL esterase/lipase At2g31550-like n=1 Tax=Papaver somniferum TaxID=3469 RepID=UPI000E6F8336|nr:GDSL esterase/lipase At2g31550-like [Papaver somniferum]
MNHILIFFSIILFSGKNCYASKTPPAYPAILIFGDLTVDTGNNNFIRTALKSDHFPYGQEFPSCTATGRFSNGLLVPDLLASSFGIKEFVPPYLDPSLSVDELRTGVSFASAGSGVDDLTTLTSGAIPVSVQLGYFKSYKEVLVNAVREEEANKIINGAFVMIAAGANDMIFNFYDTPARRFLFNITGYHDFLLEKQESLVKELYDLGCRILAVSGMAPLRCIPFQITVKHSKGRKCLKHEITETEMYNSKLKKLSQTLPASLPGRRITYLDNYNPVMDMIKNPQNYGLVETNKGCC